MQYRGKQTVGFLVVMSAMGFAIISMDMSGLHRIQAFQNHTAISFFAYLAMRRWEPQLII